MKPGLGKLEMFPSIWGRKCIPFHFVPFADCRVVRSRLGWRTWGESGGCQVARWTAIPVLL